MWMKRKVAFSFEKIFEREAPVKVGNAFGWTGYARKVVERPRKWAQKCWGKGGIIIGRRKWG